MPGQRIEQPCPTCQARGLLPLDALARQCLQRGLRPGTCGDWLECHDCGATGTFVMYERAITPGKSFLMPGLRQGVGL